MSPYGPVEAASLFIRHCLLRKHLDDASGVLLFSYLYVHDHWSILLPLGSILSSCETLE